MSLKKKMGNGRPRFTFLRIFSDMENNNHFEKFMQDLEKRNADRIRQQEALAAAAELWEKRHGLDVRYRESAHERIRYKK